MIARPDWIGSSRPPYTNWPVRAPAAELGGSNFIRLAYRDLRAGAR